MLHVTSEVGRLRRVVLHEPGPEVDRMLPAMMEELLFDDILFGDRAREEHRRFRRVMELLGVEVLRAEELLVGALERPEARQFVTDALEMDVPASVLERMANDPPRELATLLLSGSRVAGATGIEADELFEMPPAPNWCFQRDPQIVIGDGVAFTAMATAARYREALLARVIFRFNPQFEGTPVLLDPLLPHNLFTGLHRPCLEGGDVLVMSPDVVAVGLSERTNRAGVHALLRGLRRRPGGPRWLLVVELPRRRAYMHLDTLFTPVDRNAALVYPPVILADGLEAAHVYEHDLHAAEDAPVLAPDLLRALARRGVDLEPIPCGGSDPVVQQREQWTDGANALALAPGVIVLYDRNVGTAEELSRRGFRVVHADDLLLGRVEIDRENPGRVAILLSSHEISRARGGPHCLSHPLVRDGV